MRILVTGASGYIGTALANYYSDRGNDVVGFDRGGRYHAARSEMSYKLVVGDLRDSSAVRRMFDSFSPDLVSHHAAHIDPRESWEDPDDDAFDNVIGTINLLKTMQRYECKRMIFASSCAVYGDQADMSEGAPYRPNAPYGAAKAAAEVYIGMYARMILGNRFITLRYPNVYGAHQSGRRSTGVVAIFSERLVRDDESTDFLYNDGRSKYMYLRIEDLCSAHDEAKTLLFSGQDNFYDTVNIPGFTATVSEIHSKLGMYAESLRIPVLAPKRVGEQESISMTGEKARSLLNWEPTISLDDGLKKAIEEKRAEFKSNE